MIMNHHNLFHASVLNKYSATNNRKVPMKAFSGMVAGQLIDMAEMMEREKMEERRRLEIGRSAEINNDDHGMDIEEGNSNYIRYDAGRGRAIDKCIFIKDNIDRDGVNHKLAKFPVIIGKNDRKRGMIKQCDTCKKHTTCFCVHCMKPLCYSISTVHARTCFADHIHNCMSTRGTNE